MKVWLTRDKSGVLRIHTQEPYYRENTSNTQWTSREYELLIDIDFPLVTFENSPIQFEIKDS